MMQEQGKEAVPETAEDQVAPDLAPGAPPATPEASAAPELAPEPATAGAGIDWASELEACRAQATEHYDAYLRARAELENVRRRAEDDISKARKFGVEAFAEGLLPVMDSLEAALADPGADLVKLREGIELTQRQLLSAFEKNRLTVIDPVREKFDPHRHQAISTEPSSEVEPNHITSVLQKGWMLSERVLRPALVKVAQSG